MTLRVDPSLTPIAPRESKARPADANDFKQFAELRRSAGANDPGALREVARQFESLFTKMMLESMRSASFGDPMFGSDQVDMYQDMMDDQLAVQLSQGRGLGLADMLIRQLAGDRVPGSASPGNKVTGTVSPVISDAQRARFIDEILPHAEAAARELGVDARGIVAQAALETGWGTSQPGDTSGTSHNLFGIKAGSSWRGASVTSDTKEYVAGVAGRENARFRAYGSVAESVGDYVQVLRNPRYAAALNTGNDVRAFATALQKGGYATDPDYANKLVAVAAQLPADVNQFKSVAAAPIPTQEPMSNG